MILTAEAAARRALPAGHDDPDSPYTLPRMLRTHYRTVTIPAWAADLDPFTRHLLIADAASDWCYTDHVRRHGPGRIPD